MFVFIADSVFVFDNDKTLISVPGAAGMCGDHLSNGSMTTELQHSNDFDEYTGTNFAGYGKDTCLNSKHFIQFLFI